MIEDIRKTALKHAMELSRDRCASEASDIVKDASVFEAYLTGQITSPAPVHNAASGVEPSLDLSACDCRIFDRDSGQFLPVRQCKLAGNDKDQPLTGCSVADCAHSNSSSVQDGESVGEVATPSRTETVVPGGGAVTEPGTHGRMDKADQS